MMKENNVYESLQLQLNVEEENDDFDDEDGFNNKDGGGGVSGGDEMDSSSSGKAKSCAGGGGDCDCDCDCSLTPEEAQRFELMQEQQQQPKQKKPCGILGVVSALFLVLLIISLLVFSPTETQEENNNKAMQDYQGPGFPAGFSLNEPLDLTWSVQSADGALAMNFDGSVLAVGDPMRAFGMTGDNNDPTPYRGRVILLQQDMEDVEFTRYYTVQILEADDDYSEFGTALAMSSYTNTLVVGIPRDIEMSIPGPTVQVYYQTTPGVEGHWEMLDEFPNAAQNDQTGSFVAISADARRIAYSAPHYQPDPGDPLHVANGANGNRRDDDQFYNPTTGAVSIWYEGIKMEVNNDIQEEVFLSDLQEEFLHGNCTYEAFGQTVAVSSSDRPVVVITRAGCYNDEDKQRTITVWEGYDGVSPIITDLLVPNEPSANCVMGQTGTAATVSQDGTRIVVLAACFNQETYNDNQAIFTFEKDATSQKWVQLVSPTEPTVIVDTDLPQYRMSRFAFDDNAMTVVLTTAGIVRGAGGEFRGMDLVCYKWNATTVSWQESWRKSDKDNTFGFFFGAVNSVALSGNGKRLAVLGVLSMNGNYNIQRPQLAVYDLPFLY
jgi:hypothetical protein